MKNTLEYVYNFLEREGENISKEKSIEILVDVFKLDANVAEQVYSYWKKNFLKVKYKMSEV